MGVRNRCDYARKTERDATLVDSNIEERLHEPRNVSGLKKQEKARE